MTALAWWGVLATGAVAGVLAGMLGIGGGAIVVPALLWLLGTADAADPWLAQRAIATSLAAIVGTGVAATLAHQRQGAIQWRLCGQLLPGLLLGAWLGAALAGVLPGGWLRRLFGAFLLYTGVLMLRPVATVRTVPWPGRGTVALAGGAIGALSALLGIGGGTLTVPYLLRHGVALRAAVATSSAGGVAIALAGVAGFAFHGWSRTDLPAHSLGFVYWPAALVILLASVPAAAFGARLAHRLPVATLKRAFALLLLLA